VLTIRQDRGSSLIWFIGVTSITLAFILVLAIASSQYLLARSVKDYSEQVALAGKTLISSGFSVDTAERYLLENLKPKKNYQIVSFKLIDSRTVQVRVCAQWSSPSTVLEISRTICESSLAR
jgi:hypothetical protein